MKLPCLLLISTLILSCSTRPSKKRYTNKVASKMIIDYKVADQKRELARIVNGNDTKKPPFLSAKKSDEYNYWLKYFTTNGKRGLITHMKNGEKYKALIEKTLEDHNLPIELYYVGLIESGYVLRAKSHASAVGPWQFMSHTAKRYNLKVTSSVDERRSIIKSTEAAARYFQDLYNIFGNWELALSAYNAGEFGVIRRIRKANTRDFYTLLKTKVLPRETRNYVPKIKAAMEVYRNPQKYGINVPKVSPFRKSSLRKYTITRRTDVNKLSRRLGISKAKLLSLNTDIKHRSIPNFRSNFDLYIPKHLKEKPQVKSYRAVAASPRSATSNRRHKVERGDSLIRIAKTYRVWVRDIIAKNNLKSKNVYIGQTLKIPASPNNNKYHVVISGDHLSKIARKYGLSVTNIKKVNAMDNSKIYPGQKLIVSL